MVTDRAGRRFRLTIDKGPENAPSRDLRQVEQVDAQLGRARSDPLYADCCGKLVKDEERILTPRAARGP